MSLNVAERRQSAAELHANLELSGLTSEEVEADLEFTPERLRSALELAPTGSDPVDVWLLRDYLHQAVQDAGRSPVPFSILTSRNRFRARMWFHLRKAPRHEFA